MKAVSNNKQSKKQQIFKIKKMMRKGLLEKKAIKRIIVNGRWEKHEQFRFVKACLNFGSDWKKVNNFIIYRFKKQLKQEQEHRLEVMHKNL